MTDVVPHETPREATPQVDADAERLLAVLVAAGYLVASRPHERSTGPYADAVPVRAAALGTSR